TNSLFWSSDTFNLIAIVRFTKAIVKTQKFFFNTQGAALPPSPKGLGSRAVIRMKFIAIFSLFFLTAVTAKTRDLPPVTEIIYACEVDEVLFKELLNTENPNLALEFPKGNAIPVHFLVKSPFSILACNPNLTVQMTETTYLRIFRKKVYMSHDLDHWDRPERFFQGKVNSTAKMSDDKSHAIIEIEIN
ncbi:MAG TPA: hypothetical protein VLE96_00620, partial [Chlamydiales bacterium]|nr:hypothetical protein [Chlamydiales bacterium]